MLVKKVTAPDSTESLETVLSDRPVCVNASRLIGRTIYVSSTARELQYMCATMTNELARHGRAELMGWHENYKRSITGLDHERLQKMADQEIEVDEALSERFTMDVFMTYALEAVLFGYSIPVNNV